MTKWIKPSFSLRSLSMSFVLSLGCFVGGAQAQTSPQQASGGLQIYAGPQTAYPGQNISVTIEMTEAHGKSAHDETVELTYMADGVATSRLGHISNGLVSFDVQAKHRAGNMTFTARTDALVSNTALIHVTAAQPRAFELKAAPFREAQRVELTTDIIRDAYGNPVSDQTLITIDWIDRLGVKQSEAAQLSQGRMSYVSLCPDAFQAPLKIRAVLKNLEVFTSELSSICTEKTGKS